MYPEKNVLSPNIYAVVYFSFFRLCSHDSGHTGDS